MDPAGVRSYLLSGLAALLLVAIPAAGQWSGTDQARGEQLVESLQLAEWMGPLAPVALSPYFGLTCLSGAAILSANGILPENVLLTSNPVLGHPLAFAILLSLSILTSLPRLTKVSKSLAQMIDPLETYSGIIAYLAVVLVARNTGGTGEALAAGVLGSSLAGLLYLAMVLNLIVVNTVRFFFETLILLSPIPAVDALFEGANKIAVAGLIALYAFSPPLAFVLNLVILAICLILFRRVYRRTVYFRHVLVGLFIKSRRDHLVAEGLSVFPRRATAAFKPYQHVHLHHGLGGWTLCTRTDAVPLDAPLRLETGLVTHTLWAGDQPFAITRRQDPALPQLASELQAEFGDASPSAGSLRALFGSANRSQLAPHS